jgi:hypothetical protein
VKINNNKNYYEKINLNNRTFLLVMVLTSFTTPETNNILDKPTSGIFKGTRRSAGGNMKLILEDKDHRKHEIRY